MLSAAQAALADHLHAHAIRTDGPFTLRSGVESSWYLDARQTTFSGEGAALVAAAVLEALEPVDAIGGLTMGADPVALATAMLGAQRGLNLGAFSIRKAAKAHGTGGRLVGPVAAGDRVAVLEDTTTTGGAFFEAVDVATAEGLEVVQAIAVVDRSGALVGKRMADRGLGYLAILTPLDLGFDA